MPATVDQGGSIESCVETNVRTNALTGNQVVTTGVSDTIQRVHLRVDADCPAAISMHKDGFPASLGTVHAPLDLPPGLLLHESREQLCRLDLLPGNLRVVVHLERDLAELLGQGVE